MENPSEEAKPMPMDRFGTLSELPANCVSCGIPFEEPEEMYRLKDKMYNREVFCEMCFTGRQWRCTKDALPPKGNRLYLIAIEEGGDSNLTGTRYLEVGKWNDDKMAWEGFDGTEENFVSHWMNLPEMPREVEDVKEKT